MWDSRELSNITSCPAVPAVTAHEPTSVFPHLRHAAEAFSLHAYSHVPNLQPAPLNPTEQQYTYATGVTLCRFPFKSWLVPFLGISLLSLSVERRNR